MAKAKAKRNVIVARAKRQPARDNEREQPRKQKRVFVVHGRNMEMRNSIFAFLRAIGLQPLEWSQAVKETGEASPYIGNVLDTAFSKVQAIVVLMTPDDIAQLRPEFCSTHEESYEKQLTPQARPNVLFEAGMAMGRDPKRTVLVEVGRLRPFSDIGGRHVLRLKDTGPSRQELADRLKSAGCDVDLSGTDWHSTGSFLDSNESAENKRGAHFPEEATNSLNAPAREFGVRARAVYRQPSTISIEVVNLGRQKIIINKMEAIFENGEKETKPPKLTKVKTGNLVLLPIELHQQGDIDYVEEISHFFRKIPVKLTLIDTLDNRYPVQELDKAIAELNKHPLSPKKLADGIRKDLGQWRYFGEEEPQGYVLPGADFGS